MARFQTLDTFRGYPENPQSLNLYTYVRNSPLNYSDASGHYTGKGFAGERTVVDIFIDDEGEIWIAEMPELPADREWTQAEKAAFEEWTTDQATVLMLKQGYPIDYILRFLGVMDVVVPGDCESGGNMGRVGVAGAAAAIRSKNLRKLAAKNQMRPPSYDTAKAEWYKQHPTAPKDKGWELDHRIPRKYEWQFWRDNKFAVNDVSNLRLMPDWVNLKIRNKWNEWSNQMAEEANVGSGRWRPTLEEAEDFARKIDAEYGEYFWSP